LDNNPFIFQLQQTVKNYNDHPEEEDEEQPADYNAKNRLTKLFGSRKANKLMRQRISNSQFENSKEMMELVDEHLGSFVGAHPTNGDSSLDVEALLPAHDSSTNVPAEVYPLDELLSGIKFEALGSTSQLHDYIKQYIKHAKFPEDIHFASLVKSVVGKKYSRKKRKSADGEKEKDDKEKEEEQRQNGEGDDSEHENKSENGDEDEHDERNGKEDDGNEKEENEKEKEENENENENENQNENENENQNQNENENENENEEKNGEGETEASEFSEEEERQLQVLLWYHYVTLFYIKKKHARKELPHKICAQLTKKFGRQDTVTDRNKIIFHAIALALHLCDFHVNVETIADDLALTVEKCRMFAQVAGCTSTTRGSNEMKLKAPLKIKLPTFKGKRKL